MCMIQSIGTMAHNQLLLKEEHIYMCDTYIATVPFNYNFIFTRVNTRGTTRNIHSIPVTCLRGPRFLVACVVYFITGTTRVKQLLSLHAWNKPRVHSHV